MSEWEQEREQGERLREKQWDKHTLHWAGGPPRAPSKDLEIMTWTKCRCLAIWATSALFRVLCQGH